MVDEDIVEYFLIFLLEMSISSCIMFQYNIKFQIYWKYLSKLKKKIKKATISQISLSYVHMLFWNRVFQCGPWNLRQGQTPAAGIFDPDYC